jgi:DNA-binding response OmpR family regulator
MIDESIISGPPTIPRGQSILVFDPDPKMAVFYRFLLASQGFIPVCVSSLQDAMAALAADPERYAVVIVDIDDDDAPGWHFVQSIREMNCSEKMPVLAIAELIGTRAVFSRMRELCDAIILKGDFEIPRFHEHLISLMRQKSRKEDAFFNAQTSIC